MINSTNQCGTACLCAGNKMHWHAGTGPADVSMWIKINLRTPNEKNPFVSNFTKVMQASSVECDRNGRQLEKWIHPSAVGGGFLHQESNAVDSCVI